MGQHRGRQAHSRWTLFLAGSAFMLAAMGSTVIALLAVLVSISQAERVEQTSGAPFQKRGNAEIISLFRENGLTADVIRGATKDERDAFSTWLVVEATPFALSNQPEERGMIFTFRDVDDLKRMEAYYRKLNNSLPQYKSWVFVRNNVLVQINGQVPHARANEYAAVLDSLENW